MSSADADDRTTSPTLPPADEAPSAGRTTDVVAAPVGQRTAAYEGGATAAPSAEIPETVPTSLPTFPGYAILGVLGRGGMGVVYKARNLAIKRLVALKVILAGEHAGEAQRARFKAEAEAVARLQHPGIVQIYEVGEHDGKPFIALEFCPGGSLDTHLNGTPLPPHEAAQLVEKLARAIHAAHQARVIHRDLKPANVLLQIADLRLQIEKPTTHVSDKSAISNLQSAIPKITDFGLAKKLDDASQTQSGAIVGTPSYMAPEQAGGQGKELGPPADIYALGAILYELLTGRPPFKAATPLDTIMQVVTDEPVPPTQLQSRTPKDLETICLKCLRKEPGNRYASAAELADDLGRYCRGEPIWARPVGRVERGVKWVRRNRGVTAAVAAAVLALLIGTTVASWQAIEAHSQAELAKKQTTIANNALAERTSALQAAREKQAELTYNTALDKILLAQAAFDNGLVPVARSRLDEVPAELRSWEWRYLKRQFDGGIFTLFGHAAPVLSVAMSADGARLMSSGSDGSVRIWNARTGALMQSFKAAPAACLAFNPDGTRFVTGSSATAPAYVWDADTGKPLFQLGIVNPEKKTRKLPPSAIFKAAFTPDGTRIVTGTVGGGGERMECPNWRTSAQNEHRHNPQHIVQSRRDASAHAHRCRAHQDLGFTRLEAST
jgi:hypothetical protein